MVLINEDGEDNEKGAAFIIEIKKIKNKIPQMINIRESFNMTTRDNLVNKKTETKSDIKPYSKDLI